MQEAWNKRAAEISQFLRENDIPEADKERHRASFALLMNVLKNDLNSDNKSRKTINRFNLTFQKFTEFLGKKHPYIDNINKVRGPIFAEYKDYIVLELGRKHGWRAELTVIKAMFNRLRKRGYCSKEVLEELKEFKRPPRREKYYRDIPKSDIRKLLSYIDKNRSEIYGIIYFIYRLGWRIEETCLLRRTDIKWNGFKPIELLVRAETTKTKRKRILDIFDEDLANVIRRYAFDRRKTIFLFPNRRNNKFLGGRVRDYLKKASKEVLGYEITPHYFRHRFCTIMGRSGIPIADVMAITGIKDTKVLLNYYTHSTQQGKEKVLEQSRLV